MLEDAVRRGLATDRKYLFVMDGSKALRAAMDAVFGAENPVQRCRHHKIENVMGYLPEHLKEQTKAVMRAAFRLPAKQGMAKLEKQAEWLGLSPGLMRCLVSTNVIESPIAAYDCTPAASAAGAMGRWSCAGLRQRC